MSDLKILNIVGARPNFMKIAPLCRVLARYPGVSQKLIHTGQHYDDNLSRIFFSELGIPDPDLNLGIGSGTREEQIARIMEAFEPVLRAEEARGIVVVGDVNSTIACARVAEAQGVKVAHVEAGLRSFDLSMPEEHNRRETDEISDLLFVTEESGMKNLEDENARGQAFLVGNVMIDTLVYCLDQVKRSDVLSKLGLTEKRYAVSTFHRPSNVDRREDLSALLETIRDVCSRIPLLLPLHPRTKHSLENHKLMAEAKGISDLILTDPLGYIDFMKLVLEAKLVITDSGGIQEETSYLSIPCITMRENTERPATLTLGTNVLVGLNRDRVMEELDKVLKGTFKSGSVMPFWEGRSAERIAEIMIREWSE